MTVVIKAPSGTRKFAGLGAAAVRPVAVHETGRVERPHAAVGSARHADDLDARLRQGRHKPLAGSGLTAYAVLVADQQCVLRIACDGPGGCGRHALRGVPVFDPFVAGPAHQAFAIHGHPDVAVAVHHDRVAAAGRQPVLGAEAAPGAIFPARQAVVAAHQHTPFAVHHQRRLLPDRIAVEQRQRPHAEPARTWCAVEQGAGTTRPQPAVVVAQHAVPAIDRHALVGPVDLYLALRIDGAQLVPAADPQRVAFHRQTQHLGEIGQAHARGGVQQIFAMPTAVAACAQHFQFAAIGDHRAPCRAGKQHAFLQVFGFIAREFTKAVLVADEQRLEAGDPQTPIGRFADRGNRFVAQAVQHHLLKDAAVVAIQPALGAHPHQGAAGLQQAGAGKTEQALVVGIATDAGALRAGQIGKRQQRQQQHRSKRCPSA